MDFTIQNFQGEHPVFGHYKIRPSIQVGERLNLLTIHIMSSPLDDGRYYKVDRVEEHYDKYKTKYAQVFKHLLIQAEEKFGLDLVKIIMEPTQGSKEPKRLGL